MVNRLIILGNGGSGKSTLALKLGQELQLPVFHLDHYYWQPNWQPVTPRQWREIHNALIAAPTWIMEGTQYRELAVRLQHADKIIFLDIHPVKCAWRMFKKHFFSPPKQDGYQYQFKWRNLWWILRYNQRYRQKIFALLQEADCEVEIRIN